MDHNRLDRYRRLYKSASRMGADRIFNAFTGLEPGTVVPMSVSHGVDFGHLTQPMDVEKAEPIHWAYNERIRARARGFKPTVSAPHPFAMLGGSDPDATHRGTLVIGPPPGPENDSNLLKLLGARPGLTTVLVKPRGNFEASLDFWREHGVAPVTAGSEGINFYQCLHSILSGADVVVGCNFSSALIFAAAIGKRVELLQDYWHTTYMGKGSQIDFRASEVRDVVLTFLHRSEAEVTSCARNLLGIDQAVNPRELSGQYQQAIEEISAPVYFRRAHSPPVRYLLTEAARVTGRVGILNDLGRGLVEQVFGRQIYATRINEIALWSTGNADRYYVETKVPYVKGRTEGGLAVSAYPTNRPSEHT